MRNKLSENGGSDFTLWDKPAELSALCFEHVPGKPFIDKNQKYVKQWMRFNPLLILKICKMMTYKIIHQSYVTSSSL